MTCDMYSIQGELHDNTKLFQQYPFLEKTVRGKVDNPTDVKFYEVIW